MRTLSREVAEAEEVEVAEDEAIIQMPSFTKIKAKIMDMPKKETKDEAATVEVEVTKAPEVDLDREIPRTIKNGTCLTKKPG
jgi:hypothetical protein